MAFVERFGPYAGWAHNTLFIAELASQQVHALLARMWAGLSPTVEATQLECLWCTVLDVLRIALICSVQHSAASPLWSRHVLENVLKFRSVHRFSLLLPTLCAHN